MSQIYHQLFYHVVWATKYRRAMISEEVERVLFPYLENKAKRFHCVLHGINGIGNHVHVAMSIPPSVSISEIVGKLKGSSSYFLNKELQITEHFDWQDGYGVLSFSKKDLPKILHYIQEQKAHHQNGELNQSMERMTEESD
ncbi:MAG: IS200/IS605 family transposase [Bacteroidota bacterium]